VAVEPKGSILGSNEHGDYEVEGIGMRTLHPTMDLDVADEIISVPDDRAFRYVRRLATECGVLAGSSAGASVWAAVQVAQRLGPGKRVVTLIPDSSERYLSKDIYEKFPEKT
jgi:cysteine synthase